MSKKFTITKMIISNTYFNVKEFSFSSGLNCIMGARGTGKTTVLEFIRYALNQVGPEDDIKQKQIQNLLSANLGNGVIELFITDENSNEYRIERSFGGEPIVFDKYNAPTKIEVSGFYAADIYGQGDIEALAMKPNEQLVRLIDGFDPIVVRGINYVYQQKSEELEKNAFEITSVTNENIRLLSELSQYGDVEKELKNLESGIKLAPGVSQEEYSDQQNKLDNIDKEKHLLTSVDEWISQQEGILLDYKNILNEKPLINASTLNLSKETFEILQSDINTYTDTLGSIIFELDKNIKSLRNKFSINGSKINKIHESIQIDYRKFLSTYKSIQSQTQRIIKLREEIEKTKKIISLLAKNEKTIRELKKERRKINSEIEKLYEERFNKRFQIAEDLNNLIGEEIKIDIQRGSLRDAYYAGLMELFYGSQLRYTSIVEKIVSYYSPVEFANVLRNKDRNSLIACLGFDDSRIEQIISHFYEDTEEKIFRIESLPIDDLPIISLKIKQSGAFVEKFRSANHLSTGQKCTTILPILMVKSSSPLIIDQPEDNLDNQYIYTTIIKLIESVKKERQLIFITHNPNIPVLGDAQKNIFLRSDEGKGNILNEGNVDEVKKEIVEILEGGKEAFDLRRVKYGK